MFDLLFAETNSSPKLTYHIDPRVKLAILICFIVVLLSTSIYYPLRLIILALVPLPLLLFSDMPLSKFARLLAKIYPMILLISMFQLIVPVSQSQIYSGFGLDISNSNLLSVLEFQLHTLLTFTATILFVITTPFIRFLKSLEKLKLPAWIISTVFFIYRFVYILSHELNRMYIAYNSRYIKLSVIDRFRVQAKLFIVFITRIFERNDQLYHALISRGFNGSLSFNVPLRWRISDTLILISALLLLTVVIVL